MKRACVLFAVCSAFLIGTARAQDKAERKALKAAAKAEAGGAGEASGRVEPAVKSEGFAAYKNVSGKNIFDPSRRSLRVETAAARPTGATNRGRSLALTGTMVADGKSLAFFGGSAADGSRVVAVGSSVANYKVTAISPTQVSLEHDGKALTLEVGRQITFEGGPGDAGPAAPVVEAAPEPATDATGTPAVPGPAGDKAEILRRMMERRAKEGGR